MAFLDICVGLQNNTLVLLQEMSINRTVRELEDVVLTKKKVDGLQKVYLSYRGANDDLVLLRPEQTVDDILAAILEETSAKMEEFNSGLALQGVICQTSTPPPAA